MVNPCSKGGTSELLRKTFLCPSFALPSLLLRPPRQINGTLIELESARLRGPPHRQTQKKDHSLSGTFSNDTSITRGYDVITDLFAYLPPSYCDEHFLVK